MGEIISARRVLAKRTRIWKIDGQYKTAKLLEGEATAAIVVSQEEGFLVAPPGPEGGESREAFESYLGELLDFHVSCNQEEEDEGMHVAWFSDDYEHHRYTFGSIFLDRYERLLSLGNGTVEEKVNRMERLVLSGDGKGCIFGVDVKHKEIDLVTALPSKVRDSKLYQKCFGIGQSRFSYPQRPRRVTSPVEGALTQGMQGGLAAVLKRAVRWPAKDFRRWARQPSRRFIVAEARRFMRRSDVVHHGLWVQFFGLVPPWGEVARVASLVSAGVR